MAGAECESRVDARGSRLLDRPGERQRLRVAWRFRFRARPGFSACSRRRRWSSTATSTSRTSTATSTPSTWRRGGALAAPFGDVPTGPERPRGGRRPGLRETDSSAFALDAATGAPCGDSSCPPAPVRRHRPAGRRRARLLGTSVSRPGGRRPLRPRRGTGADPLGASTRQGAWAVPSRRAAAGPGSRRVRRGREVYWGTANPIRTGARRRTRTAAPTRHGALHRLAARARRGPAGSLWYDQVTPHDVRDYDFQLSPILLGGGRTLVFGAGKAGRVIAWDRATRRRVWETAVGSTGTTRPASPATRSPSAPGCSAASRRRWRSRTDGSSSRSSTCACPAAPPATSRSTRSTSPGAAASSSPSTPPPAGALDAQLPAAGLRLRHRGQRRRLHLDLRRAPLRARRRRRPPSGNAAAGRHQLVPGDRRRHAARRGRRAAYPNRSKRYELLALRLG